MAKRGDRPLSVQFPGRRAAAHASTGPLGRIGGAGGAGGLSDGIGGRDPGPWDVAEGPVGRIGPGSEGLQLVEMKIVDEPIPDPTVDAMPKEDRLRLEELQPKVFKNPGRLLKELEALAARNPRVPKLQNFLLAALQATGDHKRAAEVCARTVRDFPSYVFGFCTLVQMKVGEGKLDEARALVEQGPNGPRFLLPQFDPSRDTFHVSELVAYTSMVGRYLAARGRVEEAVAQLEMMEEIAPGCRQAEALCEAIERAELSGLLTSMTERLLAEQKPRAPRKKAGGATKPPRRPRSGKPPETP